MTIKNYISLLHATEGKIVAVSLLLIYEYKLYIAQHCTMSTIGFRGYYIKYIMLVKLHIHS